MLSRVFLLGNKHSTAALRALGRRRRRRCLRIKNENSSRVTCRFAAIKGHKFRHHIASEFVVGAEAVASVNYDSMKLCFSFIGTYLLTQV